MFFEMFSGMLYFSMKIFLALNEVFQMELQDGIWRCQKKKY